MSLEYIDIGNPGAPNNDPATNAPYNPTHLLIPAHVNAPGGTLVIFNNSTNDLFFTLPYNRYRVKVPATQKRQVALHTTEPHGISYVVGTTTAVLVGQPDVYIECYEPGECVPPFNEGASGVAVASASIPVTIAAAKGWTYTSPLNNPFGPFTIIDTLAPAAGLYGFVYVAHILDANVTPPDELQVGGGNNTSGIAFNGAFFYPLYQAANTPPTFRYADGLTPYPGPNVNNGLPQYVAASEGDNLYFQVAVTNTSGQAFVHPPSVRVDAALVLYQPY